MRRSRCESLGERVGVGGEGGRRCQDKEAGKGKAEVSGNENTKRP